MYDEFFIGNNIIMDTKLPYALKLIFWKWEELFNGDKRLKLTEWVTASLEDHLGYPAKKEYWSSHKP